MDGRNTGGVDEGASLHQYRLQLDASYNKQLQAASEDTNNAQQYLTTLGGKDSQPTDLQVQFTNLVTTVRATRANNDQGPAHQMDFDEVEDDDTQVQKLEVKDSKHFAAKDENGQDMAKNFNEDELNGHQAKVPQAVQEQASLPKIASLNQSRHSAHSQNNQEGSQQMKLSFRQSEPIQAVNASFSQNNSKLHEKALPNEQEQEAVAVNPSSARNYSRPIAQVMNMHHQQQLLNPQSPLLPSHLQVDNRSATSNIFLNRSQHHLQQSNANVNNRSNILDVSAPFTDNLNYDLDIVQDDAIDHETVSTGRLMSLRNMPNYHRTIKRADWEGKNKLATVQAQAPLPLANPKRQQDQEQPRAQDQWQRVMPPHPNNFRVSPGRGRVGNHSRKQLDQRALGLFEAARSSDRTFVSNEKAPEVIIRHENANHLSGVLNFFNTEAKNPQRSTSHDAEFDSQFKHQANEFNQRSARIMPGATQNIEYVALATPARDFQAGQVASEAAHQLHDASYSQLLNASQLNRDGAIDHSVQRRQVQAFEPALVRIVKYRQTEYDMDENQSQDNGMRPTAVQNYGQHAAKAEEPVKEEEQERRTRKTEDDALVHELQAKIQMLQLENQKLKDEAKDQRESHDLKIKQTGEALKEANDENLLLKDSSKIVKEQLDEMRQKAKRLQAAVQDLKLQQQQLAEDQEALQAATEKDVEASLQKLASAAKAQSVQHASLHHQKDEEISLLRKDLEQAKKENLQQQVMLKAAAETEASLKRAEELNRTYEQKIEKLQFKIWALEEDKSKQARKAESQVDRAIQTDGRTKASGPAKEPLENEAEGDDEYHNSDCEADDEEAEDRAADDDEKGETPQKNPVFDKYVDTQLLVTKEQKPLRKSATKPQEVEARSEVKPEEEKEEQVKTSYYALATGKAAPPEAIDRRRGSKKGEEDDEESEEEDDDDEDEDHTFKTITEKPFEEDQVTTVQNSVSRARISQTKQEPDAFDPVPGQAYQEDDEGRGPSSDHTQEKDYMNNESLKAAGIVSPHTVEGQEAEQLSGKSRKSAESRLSKKTERSYDFSVKTQQQQQQQFQMGDASEKYQQDFSNLKAKFESILKKDDEIQSLNNEIEKSTRSLSRGRRSQLCLRAPEDDKQVVMRPHSQQVQQQPQRSLHDQFEKQEESCCSEDRREVIVKDMMADKEAQDGILKRVEGLMPTEQQQIPLSLTLSRHQAIVRTTRVNISNNQPRQARPQLTKDSSDDSEEEKLQANQESVPQVARPPSPPTKQSSKEVKGTKEATIAVAVEPQNSAKDRPPELAKASRGSPEQMKTPMVIELNNDDSDQSPNAAPSKERPLRLAVEPEQVKPSSKDDLGHEEQEPNHQSDFQLSTSQNERENTNMRGPAVPSFSFGSSAAVAESANGSAVHQLDEETMHDTNSQQPQQAQGSPHDDADKLAFKMDAQEGQPEKLQQTQESKERLGGERKPRDGFVDAGMDEVPEHDEMSDGPGIAAKLKHGTLSQDNRTKAKNPFTKQGHRAAPAEDNQKRSLPSPSKIRTYPSPLKSDKRPGSPTALEKVAEANNGLQEEANNTAASIAQWRPSNASNDVGAGPAAGGLQPLPNASNAPSSIRGTSDAGLGSFDEEIEHSPPRKSVQNLNSSEKKQTSIQKQQESQRQQSPTPRKSSSSNNSGGDDDLSDEEDSHLITITERTYEESCTAMNTSGLSQVSMSQMIMDDIKQKLQNKNLKGRKPENPPSSEKKQDGRLSDTVVALGPNELAHNSGDTIAHGRERPGSADEDNRQKSQKNDIQTTFLTSEKKEEERKHTEENRFSKDGLGFETLLNDLQTAPLRSSAQLTQSDASHLQLKASMPKNTNSRNSRDGEQKPEMADLKAAWQRSNDTAERPSKITEHLENFSHTEFGEFEKDMVDRQMVKPALATMASPGKVTPIQQAQKRGLPYQSTQQMQQQQANRGATQATGSLNSIQNIHSSLPTQKKPNKYFASTHMEQDRGAGGSKMNTSSGHIQMNNSVAAPNLHDSSNTRLDESGKHQNKSQYSGWHNTSQQSLALLTPLQIISLASNSEKDASQNNISYQYLVQNESSLNTTKHRASGSADTQNVEMLNQSRASQRSKRRPTESTGVRPDRPNQS